MKLLKNEKEFDSYCDVMLFDWRISGFPKKYPCFAYEAVKDWGMEESAPVFLYAEDLEKMLVELQESTDENR